MNPFMRRRPGLATNLVLNPAARLPRRRRPALEVLEGRRVLTLLGPDQQVNPAGSILDFASDNASSADGTSVVVWVDNYYGTGDHDIWAQRYDVNGVKYGDPIQVDYTTSDSLAPAVAMNSDGSFAVAWQDNYANGSHAIFLRVFDAWGDVSGKIEVSQPGYDTSPGQILQDYAPDVAISNGSVMVSYTHNYSATDQDVLAHRYTLGDYGVLTDAGAFYVATTGESESQSSVAMAPDGRFDIAFQAGGRLRTDHDIYLYRYQSSGLYLDHLTINNSSRDQQNPSVSINSKGDAVVAYQEWVPSAGMTPGAYSIIVANRVSSAGAVGVEAVVAAYSGSNQANPSVALGDTGSYAVTYDGQNPVQGNGVWVAMVPASDTRIYPVVTYGGPADGVDAAVSVDGFGRVLVTYTRNNAFGPGTQGVLSSRGLLV
jgi:hypothetical protein